MACAPPSIEGVSELERVRVWAEALLRLHLDDSWSFAFDRATRRAGLCDYAKKAQSASRATSRSGPTMMSCTRPSYTKSRTALAGPRAGHGGEWKRIAAELGYVGGRTHDQPIAEDRARWRGHCPAGHEFVRFRRPTRELACGRCGHGFSRDHLIQWRAVTR